MRVDACLGRIQSLIQDFKAKGLAGGEAHRLDQYIGAPPPQWCDVRALTRGGVPSKVGIAFERLTSLKEYSSRGGAGWE
eukprot:gene603-7105_t